jgi:hypothetical protein
MKVTDLNYYMDTRLKSKIDIMIKRCTNKRTRKDAVLIVEGSEGEGKTNTSEAIAYYIKHTTGKEIHMFFRLKSLIEFAKKTEGHIIIWDEPALDSLSTDWYKETNKDLIRLLMTCRKKRHFFLFNFVKFYKFPEYVVVDRGLGLIHMFTQTKANRPGCFAYIRQKQLEKLFITYKQKKIRNYGKLKAFIGTIPLVEPHLDKMGLTIEGKPNATLQDYEALKDKSIESIGTTKQTPNKHKTDLDKLKVSIATIDLPVTTKTQLAAELGISTKTLQRWTKIDLNSKESNETPT